MLQLKSGAFEHEGVIPDKYSKTGGNISPSLMWTGVPPGARSLSLIVDDPDAPSGIFVHWLVYGIQPTATGLEEGLPATPTLPNGVKQGHNDFGELGYGGPQPPSGTHRYFFHLYAIDRELQLPPGASRKALDKALSGHVLEEAQLMGKYKHREPGSRAA
jgi:Raf kinase inhibitor-like YbhB/YbcL family protein